MPPVIALFLCTVFVVYLLKLDYQNYSEEIFPGWIPTLWLLLCGSKPLGVWFGSKQSFGKEELSTAVMQGSTLDRVFLGTLMLLCLIILVRREIDWSQFVKDNKWLFLLFLFMLVSIFWSDYTFVSLKRWIRAFGIVLMSFIVLTDPYPEKQIQSILKRFVYISIPFSVLVIKYYPQLGINWGKWSGSPAWAGIATGKNALGVICMFSSFFLIWILSTQKNNEDLPHRKYETICQVLILGMAQWLLRGPGAFSATSTVVLIIGLVILFLLKWEKINSNIFFIACSCILIMGVAYPFMWESFANSGPINFITTLLGRDPTLTNRGNMIWDKLTPVAIESAALGKGYGGFWIKYLIFEKHYINEAHNGYLDILIQIGVVGFIIFTIVLYTFFKRSISVLWFDREWGSFLLSYLFMSLLHNITESSYLFPTALIWNLLVLFIITCPREKSE